MWSFSKVGPQETRAKSKLADFFESKRGNAGDAESLIRESLQNALDAKSRGDGDEPVRVKLTIGVQSRLKNEWLFDALNARIDVVQKQTNRVYPMRVEKEFGFVLIEDFNTTGFEGTFNNDDDECKGSLVRFWWEEGISEKRKGAGGSHGVGKVTLSEASSSRVFFAYSKRGKDQKEVLFGYSRLGAHTYEGKSYREYSRFGIEVAGKNNEENQLHPYSAPKLNTSMNLEIEKFKKSFGIDRTSFGSSILIPNIDVSDLDIAKLINATLDNFYLPIMKKLLVIEFVDLGSNIKETLDDVSLDEISNTYKKENSDFSEKIHLASYLIKGRGGHTSSSEFIFSYKKRHICTEVFSEKQLVEIREEYESGDPVKVRFNVPLYPANGESENGFFDIAVQKKKKGADKRGFYEVFRGEVRIKDEKLVTGKASAILDIFGFVGGESENPLSEFMKYCEDPGHRNWDSSINRRNEALHYRRKETWQKELVRNAVRDLVKILENERERKIEDFADDIFYILKHVEKQVPSKVEVKGGIEGQNKKGKDVVPKIPTIPKSTPMVSISKINNGIKIKPTKVFQDSSINMEVIPEMEIVICYEMLGSSKASWKRFGKMEIDLIDEIYLKNTKNVEIIKIQKNILYFRPLSRDFSLEISGFDPNRQLYIDIKDRRVANMIKGVSNDNC